MADSLSVKDSPITGKVGSADDVMDLLNDDTDLEPEEKEVKEVKEVKEPKEKKEKEEKEEEEIELKEPKEDEELEKLELTEEDENKIDIEAPPRKKEILKKYPELFKDFPFMEKILYRDRQYTELFGSFDDAKELAERAEIFTDFETQLLGGNTESILKNVKDADPKAFDKIVDDYLPTLHKVDKEAYFEVIEKINKTVIMEMVKEAKESNNEELQNAAAMLNQFLYGTTKFTPAKTRVDEKNDDKKNEVEDERLAFVRERFETSRDEMQTRVDNTLKSTINEYIDPKNVMSAYLKKTAVNDTLKLVHDLVARDPSVRNTLDKLWRGATDSKFSRDSLGKIQSFYLGKAKGNLKAAILKIKGEALKDLAPKRAKEDDEEREEKSERTPARRGIIPSGRPSSQQNKGGMKKGESVLDYFGRD